MSKRSRTERHASRRSRVFVARSLRSNDRLIVAMLKAELRRQKLSPISGEKPSAGSVSRKVMGRIDSCAVFVALLTSEAHDFHPSPWIVSELGYAARHPRVVLLEAGMGEREIGGIQGDVEYLRFTRTNSRSGFRRAAAAAKRVE